MRMGQGLYIQYSSRVVVTESYSVSLLEVDTAACLMDA
jgi:hypothetical protein